MECTYFPNCAIMTNFRNILYDKRNMEYIDKSISSTFVSHYMHVYVFPVEPVFWCTRFALCSTPLLKVEDTRQKKESFFLLQSRPIAPLRKESVCICICTSTISTMLYRYLREVDSRKRAIFYTDYTFFQYSTLLDSEYRQFRYCQS